LRGARVLSPDVLADRLNPKISVSIVFVAAMFMAIMDTTIVNVALPVVGRDFGVAADHVDSVVVGFLVSLAVFIPASGWLGDRFGTRRVFLTAVVVFTVASALCGLAQSLDQLVAFRILQGVGGGMLTPVGMAMLFRTFPPEERVKASSILVVPTAFAPALGPVLGGFLVTDVTWRWVFYVNLPVGLAALVFGILFLPDYRRADAGRFDTPGFLLAGVGFGALMYALSEGPIRGWSSAAIIAAGLAGIALLAILVRVELRSPAPMIHLRLLTNGLFRNTTIVMFLATTAFLGTLYLVALYFQDGLGTSALVSGLSTFPEALGVQVGAQVATRIYPQVGPRRMMTVGLVGVAVSMLLLAITGQGDLWWIRAIMVLLGVSMAQVFTPSQAAAFATISPDSTGQASTLFNAARQMGSALGVAVLSTVIAAVGVTRVQSGHLVPNLTAYHVAFLTAAAVALVAAARSRSIDDAAAAPTMRPRRRAVEAVERAEAGSSPLGPQGSEAKPVLVD
jgi:EmrB/QacA subfamily drug resistance transporter